MTEDTVKIVQQWCSSFFTSKRTKNIKIKNGVMFSISNGVRPWRTNYFVKMFTALFLPERTRGHTLLKVYNSHKNTFISTLKKSISRGDAWKSSWRKWHIGFHKNKWSMREGWRAKEISSQTRSPPSHALLDLLQVHFTYYLSPFFGFVLISFIYSFDTLSYTSGSRLPASDAVCEISHKNSSAVTRAGYLGKILLIPIP